MKVLRDCSLFIFSLLTTLCDLKAQEKTVSGGIVVFEPGTDYATTRIPALAVSKKGTLLAFCEARVNSTGDWADIDLLMRRSMDGGKTWEPAIIIAQRESGRPVSNPTPIVGMDGVVHLLFHRNYAKAYYMRSTDDGKTWSAPVDITYAFEAFRQEYNWKVLAPGPGHSIQLKNKRLLVPVWLCEPDPSIPGGDHRPSCVATIYSDDNGKTWQRGDIVVANGNEYKNPSETAAVELSDGRVMLNIRNESEKHRRLISYSVDGISHWTKPVFDDELFEPVCMASIIRIGGDEDHGDHILFVNPDAGHLYNDPQHKTGVKLNLRQNLTAKLSYDGGKTWKHRKILDTGNAGYTDLGIGKDGSIYCLYETNSKTEGWRYSIVLKRFNLKWLTASED